MKNILLGAFLVLFAGTAAAQTVTRTHVSPTSTSVDGVGNYGFTFPAVSFTSGDFTAGCEVTDVDVTIGWAKTDGTCQAPGGGNSFHAETSFRVNGPSGSEILALPGTWSGGATTASVVTTFSTGNAIPSGTPVTGIFGPNNGALSNFNGVSPFGNWTLDAGDNGAGDPLCVVFYEVTVTTAADGTNPSLSMPANIVVNADPGLCAATVTYSTPTATDNCGVTVTYISGGTSGSLFPVGVNTVTYEAADPFGNITSDTFTVTVNDSEDPVISCPGTVFAGCDPVVNYPVPTATDNCPGVTVSLVSGPPSGGTFSTGTTTVTYEATDASGNTASCSFDVVLDTESTDPTSVTASNLNVCAGTPTTLTVNGGSLGTNAQWFWYIGSCGGQLVGAGTTLTVNPLNTSNYFVRAEGSCNSTLCASVVIDVTAAPTVGFSGITSPSACGAADGTITVVASGGTPPYAFAWSNNSTGATISGLAAGPYEVTVTDASGCTDFSSVSLNDPGASVVTLVSSDNDNIICEGESVAFTASGAFQYQFYVDGVPVSSQNPFVTTALQDGQNVYVTGTDFNFCTYTTPGISFTVYDNPDIVETITHPSACAATDGVITTSVSGGLPPYNYLWSNSETTENISGLAAGPYLITVTDDHGCFTNETYALSDPGADPATVTLTSSEDPNNEICEGENIEFTASAGFVDYEFFVDAQSVSTTNPYATTSLVNGQSVAATATDASNCTVTSNIILPTVNPGPIILLISNDADTTICIGESITFFASGALTYEFFVDGVSQGAPSATTIFVSSSLTNGQVVSVVGTDANQCDVVSDGMMVTVNPSPTLAITNISHPTECGATDGAIVALATGGTPGYSYTWSTGNVGSTVAFLNAGSYFVQAVDDAGCSAVASASLSDVGSTPVTLATSAPTDTVCGGEAVVFTASGSTTYVFYVNGEPVSTVNPFMTDSLNDGDFIAVTGLDTMLCSATSDPVQFTVHPEVQIGIVSSLNPSGCGTSDGYANTITLGGVPAYDYMWSDGQTTSNAVNLVAGQWSVLVTDVNGCTDSDAVSLSDLGAPNVVLSADPSGLVICSDTEVEFTASGANVYEFFIDGVSAGTTNPYVNAAILDGQTIAVTGTDVNSCTGTSPGLTYQVNQTPSVLFTLPGTTCSNADVLELSGGSPTGGFYTVDYDGFPIIGDLFFPELAGSGPINVDYTYVDPSSGCSTTQSADYIVFPEPEVDLGNDTSVCTLTLDAGAGFISYEWAPTFDTTQTLQVSSTDVYEVTVEDANGCIGTDDILVVLTLLPAPVISPSGTVEFCIGDSVTLTAPAGYATYEWSNGSTDESVTLSASEMITLTVSNAQGCEVTSAIVEVIMNEPQPGAEITWDGPLEFCVGGSVTLDAGPGYASYLWNSGSTTQEVIIIETGTYTVIVLDGNGCIDSSMTADPVIVNVWDPEPELYQSGDSLIVTNASEFITYQWFVGSSPIPGATGPVHVITESGVYHVEVVDDEGCSGSSFNIEMTCCVGIEEAYFDGSVLVYPNPNNGHITLEISLNQHRDIHIGMYDMVGKQVWSDKEIGFTDQIRKQYDLSTLPDGVYFLRIYADDQMTVQKLIKQQ